VLAEYLPTIGKSAPRVLDMGCGVGQFTHWLQAAGYEVLGIDRSAEMLAEAKRRFPEVRYVNSNIKYYEDHDINLITCLGETLNYLESSSELYIALSRFACNLCDGGRLVAELLDPQDLSVGWANSTRLYTLDGGWLAIFDHANLGENRGRWTTRWLRRQPPSPVVESFINIIDIKTWYPSEIVEAARDCGFCRAEVIDLARGGPAREGTISQLLIATK
jgi:SAM-dependent methyltransferase